VKTCPRCKADLPLSAFHVSKRSADGLQSACAECQNEYRRIRQAEKRAAIRAALPGVPAREGQKRCPRCDEWKRHEEFSRNRSTPDGLQSYCKACSSAIQRSNAERNGVANRRREVTPLGFIGPLPAPQSRRDGTKQCTLCRETKLLLSFYTNRNTADGAGSYCRDCDRERIRRWRAANRDRVKANNAAYAERHPERKKRDHRQWWLRLYGLTQEDYAALLAAQDGVCAICQQPERYIDARTGEPRRLAVDHDHETNRVRGLLCGRCNRSIGQFADDHERLMRASDYLRRAAE
jgi:hypothetical protein